MGKIAAPAPITATHILADFDCGVDSLNIWLKRQSMKNETSGASRTFVACTNYQVIGFYALASGSVNRKGAPGKIKRKMPETIPVMIMGRLAVDIRRQKSGIGRGLLKMLLFEPSRQQNMQVFVPWLSMLCQKIQKNFISGMVFWNHL